VTKFTRRRILRSTIGLSALVLARVLAGCNSSKPQVNSRSQLVLATLAEPKTFNYANNQVFPSVFLFTCEGLTRENGMTGAVEPALAESWQFSADKKRVVFLLRSDLQWSDGKPLTADDVVFTYQQIVFNPDVPIEVKDQLKIGTKGVFPQVRKLDDRRIEFTFPEPFAPFMQATASPNGVAILPKHALENSLKTKGKDGNLAFLSTWGTDTPPAQIVVNGPYQISSYRAGERVVFERNPYYWRDALATRNPKPIQKIIWQIIENTDVQLLKFRSGDLDILGDVRPMKAEYYALLKQEQNRTDTKILNGGAWSGVLQFVFNLSTAKDQSGKPFVEPKKAKWFNTKEFRQAIAYAIDKERINTNIYRGIGVVQYSPISVQSPFYLTPEQGLKVYEYNLAKAKNSLQKAGFKYDAQGQLFDSEGNRVEFTLVTNANNLVRVAVGAQIKQDLSKLGMKVDFQAIGFNTLVEKISATRDWDVHMIGFEGGVEPHAIANLWMTGGGSHSFNLKLQPGQKPIQDYAPKPFEEKIDQLFIRGAQEFDPKKRQKIYHEFQQVVAEEVPIIQLVNDRALMAVRGNIQGLKYNGLPTWGLWNIDELQSDNNR
jgi:peptide/nickel transport system substrate-binding protein